MKLRLTLCSPSFLVKKEKKSIKHERKEKKRFDTLFFSNIPKFFKKRKESENMLKYSIYLLLQYIFLSIILLFERKF